MKFGPVPPKKLPEQNPTKVMMLAERWQRAAYAQQKWAEKAKQAVDFFEGRQWTETQLAEMARGKRPALTFNIVAPLVRLVLGYQRQNKTDIKHNPGQDMRSTEQTADTLSKLEKVIARASRLEYVDTEVFLDGLISARGFYDTRLDYEKNDLGEARTRALDPFTVYPDPDADTYDLNESASFVQTSKWLSLDAVEAGYGKRVGELLKPWTMGQTPLAPLSSLPVQDEITPVRFFGQHEDFQNDWWDSFYMLMGDFVDQYRKSIRIIETQHKVRELRNVMIDLETGDKKVLPDNWGPEKIEKALLYAEMVGNPCVVQNRMVESIQWTAMAGDLILYDNRSQYDRFTVTGYFPYFRRGTTRGMVEDLIDPQREKNKSRSNRIEIESRTANGGWIYHTESLDQVQKARLKKYGSTPGVNIEWKGDKDAPKQITASPPAMAYERLEAQSDEDVRRISGINEAALGDVDNRATSGRAIEARQRQAVISVQMYMDNFKRSKMLVGDAHLAIVQNYYTEPRIYRVSGEDGKLSQIHINQLLEDPASGAKSIKFNVAIGKYDVSIDEAPLSATFAAAQFEEMLALLEKMGPSLGPFIPLFGDLIIGMSSMPRKDEWIERIEQVMGLMQQQGQGGAPPPGGGGMPGQDGAPLDAMPPGAGSNVVPMPMRA